MEDTENEYIPPNHDYGSMEIKPKLLTDVKRYSAIIDEEHGEPQIEFIQASIGGEWVKYEDHHTLRLKHEEKMVGFAEWVAANYEMCRHEHKEFLWWTIADNKNYTTKELLDLYRADRNKV